MLYQPPYGASANAPYVNGNPATGTRGSIPPAAAIEHPQRELLSLIGFSGQIAAANDLTQVSKAVQSGLLNFAIADGTANAITVALPVTPNAYFAGLLVRAYIIAPNTGAVTLKVNSLGAVPVKRPDGRPLAAGELSAGAVVSFVHDGTSFQAVLAPAAIRQPTTINVAASGGSATPANPLSGDPFDSLASAFVWLANWTLADSGSVSVQLSVGVHTVASGVALSHPNASKIQIKGAVLPGALPVHTDIVADIAASRTALRAKYSTIVSTTGAGLIFDGSFLLIDSIMFDHTGVGTAAGSAVMQRGGTFGLFTKCVAFGAKFGDTTGIGVSTSLNASIVWRDGLIGHCDNGAVARQNCYVDISVVTAGVATIKYCGSGTSAYTVGQVNVSGSVQILNCTIAALNVGIVGLIRVSGDTAYFGSNAINTLNNGGRIEVTSPSAGVTFLAQTGSFSHQAYAGGYTSVPNVGANTCSPAAGTPGNDNSYIRRY